MKIYELTLPPTAEALQAFELIRSRLPEGADPLPFPTGREVAMREMGTEQLLTAFGQSSGQRGGENAQQYATKLAALKLCICEVDGKPITYADLTGGLWDAVFSLKETTLLLAVWSDIHDAGAEDMALMGKGLRTKYGG